MAKYEIRRFYASGAPYKVIETYNNLEDAQAHCQSDDTSGPGWFDGFREIDDEPTDDEIYNRTQYTPDVRGENDWTL